MLGNGSHCKKFFNIYLNKEIKMIGVDYLNGKRRTVFGCNAWEIERFEEAITSEELYVPHHVLEWKYTMEELIKMGRYEKVTPDELIWMPASVHNASNVIHKGRRLSTEVLKGRKRSEETRKKIMETKLNRFKNSEFGKKYYEHFGYSGKDNPSQYNRERMWYNRHGNKCRWEE